MTSSTAVRFVRVVCPIKAHGQPNGRGSCEACGSLRRGPAGTLVARVASGETSSPESGAAAQARITELEDRLAALQALMDHATRFKIGTLYVVNRAPSGWAVSTSGEGGDVFNRDGDWEWEPQPSSRTDEFMARTRFSLEEAVRHAKEQSEVLTAAREAWLDGREARRAARAAAETYTPPSGDTLLA